MQFKCSFWRLNVQQNIYSFLCASNLVETPTDWAFIQTHSMVVSIYSRQYWEFRFVYMSYTHSNWKLCAALKCITLLTPHHQYVLYNDYSNVTSNYSMFELAFQFQFEWNSEYRQARCSEYMLFILELLFSILRERKRHSII